MRTLTDKTAQTASADRAEVTTVLVVDDHQAVRLGIQMLLDDEPAIEVVASAGSFSEGLEAAGRLVPDVAVVDYHLPDRDGLTLTHRLVTMPSPPLVLVFSAYATSALSWPRSWPVRMACSARTPSEWSSAIRSMLWLGVEGVGSQSRRMRWRPSARSWKSRIARSCGMLGGGHPPGRDLRCPRAEQG